MDYNGDERAEIFDHQVKALMQKLADSAEYDFEATEETVPVKGNACAIDEETDAAVETEIIDRLRNGDMSAWFSAHVTVRIPDCADLIGEDWLGCCSYTSLEEFEKSETMAEMKRQALYGLCSKLIEMKWFLHGLGA